MKVHRGHDMWNLLSKRDPREFAHRANIRGRKLARSSLVRSSQFRWQTATAISHRHFGGLKIQKIASASNRNSTMSKLTKLK